MKENKLILLLFCLNIGLVAYPQYNLNFASNCNTYNSAIFSQVLIEIVGQEKVSQLLESESIFYIDFSVDSLGYVENINRTSLKYPKQLDDTIKEKIKDYLISNRKRFYICYDIRPEKDTCKMYKLITEDYRKNNEQPHASGGFPVGELFYSSYKLYLEENQANPLTIFEYLQGEIKKYLWLDTSSACVGRKASLQTCKTKNKRKVKI